MATAQQQQQQMTAADAVNMNLAQRNAVLRNAIPFLQSIYGNTITNPTAQPTINIAPQNVGLIRGFLLKLTATVTNPSSGSSTLSLTPHGPANLLQNITFTDLQNYQRINTSGWHLSMLNSVKQGRPFFSSTPSDSPIGYGSNWPIIKAPATIAANTSGTINMYYWIPLAYMSTDLTGSVWANVVNATMNLQLTFANNTQAFVANTGDPSLAIYQGAGAVAGVTLTNVVATVYQDYLDQLPVDQNKQIIVPGLDLNTMYEIKNTAFSGLTVGQDFNIGYSNFRHFLSTSVIFDNQTGGAYPANGTDINYWSFRTANATDMRKCDPYTWNAFARRKLMTDPPSATYYFDTRERPIFTTQTGNTNLVLNPSVVNTNASCLVGWEMLANISNLLNAGSLASGG